VSQCHCCRLLREDSDWTATHIVRRAEESDDSAGEGLREGVRPGPGQVQFLRFRVRPTALQGPEQRSLCTDCFGLENRGTGDRFTGGEIKFSLVLKSIFVPHI
jgi:hypothetical protein